MEFRNKKILISASIFFLLFSPFPKGHTEVYKDYSEALKILHNIKTKKADITAKAMHIGKKFAEITRRIEKLKKEKQGILGQLKLEKTLARAKELAKTLDKLQIRLSELQKKEKATREFILASIDTSIDNIEKHVHLHGADAPSAKKLKNLLLLRHKVASAAENKSSPPPNLSVFTVASNDAGTLKAELEYYNEMLKKLSADIETINKNISKLKKRKLLVAELSHFLEEESFFNETTYTGPANIKNQQGRTEESSANTKVAFDDQHIEQSDIPAKNNTDTPEEINSASKEINSQPSELTSEADTQQDSTQTIDNSTVDNSTVVETGDSALQAESIPTENIIQAEGQEQLQVNSETSPPSSEAVEVEIGTAPVQTEQTIPDPEIQLKHAFTERSANLTAINNDNGLDKNKDFRKSIDNTIRNLLFRKRKLNEEIKRLKTTIAHIKKLLDDSYGISH